ncbi:MAG: CoA-binding protein [Chloroflexota bacterium]|nr:CoA-binding protein [Chloroflexota bacterium]
MPDAGPATDRARDPTAPALEAFFTPQSIAVVGASRDPLKLGYVLLDNITRARFAGPVYAVNPHADAVLGVPAFARVDEIPGPVDLAVLTIPAAAVESVIVDCARKRVRAAVVITAGFREAGAEGARREQRIVELARAGGVRIIGPNSLGIINTFASLNATFAQAQPDRYEIAVISQSGAMATAILDWARAIDVGFSKFVSLGNMADVSEVELLSYLCDDPQTKLIVAYLEGFTDGRRVLDIAHRVTAAKPLVMMKVGRSASGARAAQSHTGALASTDAVVDAALRQAGVVRAYTMEEFFDYTLAFSYLPLPRGLRLAIITNAGGPGVMAVDAVERYGLELARLSPDARARLAASLPPAASSANPIDVLGDAPADRYQLAIGVALEDPGVDAVIVLLTPQAVTEPERTARLITHLARTSGKPVAAVYMGGDAVARGRLMLDSAHVPAYHYPERAVRAIGAVAHYASYLRDIGGAARDGTPPEA